MNIPARYPVSILRTYNTFIVLRVALSSQNQFVLSLLLACACAINSRENSRKDEHRADLLNALSSNYSLRVSRGREDRRGEERKEEKRARCEARRGGREFLRALKTSLRANRSLCPRRGAGFMPLFTSRNFNPRLLHHATLNCRFLLTWPPLKSRAAPAIGFSFSRSSLHYIASFARNVWHVACNRALSSNGKLELREVSLALIPRDHLDSATSAIRRRRRQIYKRDCFGIYSNSLLEFFSHARTRNVVDFALSKRGCCISVSIESPKHERPRQRERKRERKRERERERRLLNKRQLRSNIWSFVNVARSVHIQIAFPIAFSLCTSVISM